MKRETDLVQGTFRGKTITYARNLPNTRKEDLRMVSALVPSSWFETKKSVGLSWRQLIARGFKALADIESKDAEIEYFMEKIIRLNETNTSMRARMYELEQRLKGVEEVQK